MVNSTPPKEENCRLSRTEMEFGESKAVHAEDTVSLPRQGIVSRGKEKRERDAEKRGNSAGTVSAGSTSA